MRAKTTEKQLVYSSFQPIYCKYLDFILQYYIVNNIEDKWSIIMIIMRLGSKCLIYDWLFGQLYVCEDTRVNYS